MTALRLVSCSSITSGCPSVARSRAEAPSPTSPTRGPRAYRRSYSRVAPVGFSESTPSSARETPRRWNSVNAAPRRARPTPCLRHPRAHRGCPPRRTRDRGADVGRQTAGLDDLLPVGRDEPELEELRCLAIDVVVAPLLVGGEVVTPMVEKASARAACVLGASRPGRTSASRCPQTPAASAACRRAPICIIQYV